MEEELDYRSLITIHDLRGICIELLSITKELPDEGIGVTVSGLGNGFKLATCNLHLR